MNHSSLEDPRWVLSALHSGVLGAVGLYLDRGPFDHPGLRRIAKCVTRRYACRTPAMYDACLGRCRDLYFDDLRVDERQDLLRCIHRHKTAGFPAVAVTYPALKRYLNDQTRNNDDDSPPLTGGGRPPWSQDFDRVFRGAGPATAVRDLRPGERGMPRRRCKNWNKTVKYEPTGGESDDDSEVMSGLKMM